MERVMSRPVEVVVLNRNMNIDGQNYIIMYEWRNVV